MTTQTTETQTTQEQESVQTTLEGEDIDSSVGKRVHGVPQILSKAGKQLDDPDPVRVSRWIVRLKEEGVLR